MRVSSSALPTGVAALFQQSAAARRQIERRLISRLESNDDPRLGGFSEVILPIIDYLDPYEEMLGRMNRRELYHFVDRDGEVLAVRSDFTAMLARLVAPRLSSMELPLRFFYCGDVVRYQEEQAGRQRELYQLGAELLEAPGEEAGEALEQVALRQFLDLLTAGERQRLMVVVGVAGALDQLILDRAVRSGLSPSAVVAAVLRRERWVAGDDAALRQTLVDGLPEDLSVFEPALAARLERLEEWCEALNQDFPTIEVRVDLAEFADQPMAPQLDFVAGKRSYYDGVVFRAFAGKAAEPVGGGGRYDRLFRNLGAEVNACGFSLNLDPLSSRPEGGEVAR